MPIIPVTTVDDEKYKVPTLLEGGQFVVNAKQNNLPIDMVLFFDTDNKQYRYVSTYEAPIDYVQQTIQYQNKLAEVRTENENRLKLIADTTKANQINSLADVYTKSLSWNPFEFVGNLTVNTADYLHNYLIKPIFNLDTNLGEKGATLLNNALVNIGETIDYVTGANFVKGVLQGQNVQESFTSGMGWNEGFGRQQNDWNVDTGNGVKDFGVNFLLEYASDPTNWITFGAKKLLKSGVTDNLTQVLTKSANDAGITLAKNQADDLADNIFKSVARGEDLNATTLAARLGKHVKLDDPNTYKNFLDNVATNIDIVKESRDYRILNSVTSTMDKMNRIPMQAALYTSALGIGGQATKALMKGSVNGLTYAVSKLRKAANEGGLDEALSNLDASNKAVLRNITKMSHVLNISKEIPDQVIAARTAKIQQKSLLKLRDVINANRTNTSKMVQEAQLWAKDEGFKDIFDAYAKMSKKNSRLAKGVEALADETMEVIRNYQANTQIKTWQPLIDIFKDETILPNMTPSDLRRLMDLMQSRTPLGVLDYFEDADIKQYEALTRLTKSWYYKSSINEFVDELETVRQGLEPKRIFKHNGQTFIANTASIGELERHVKVMRSILDEFNLDDDLRKFNTLVDPTGGPKSEFLNTFEHLQKTLTDYNKAVASGITQEQSLQLRNDIVAYIRNIALKNRRHCTYSNPRSR